MNTPDDDFARDLRDTESLAQRVDRVLDTVGTIADVTNGLADSVAEAEESTEAVMTVLERLPYAFESIVGVLQSITGAQAELIAFAKELQVHAYRAELRSAIVARHVGIDVQAEVEAELAAVLEEMEQGRDGGSGGN